MEAEAGGLEDVLRVDNVETLADFRRQSGMFLQQIHRLGQHGFGHLTQGGVGAGGGQVHQHIGIQHQPGVVDPMQNKGGGYIHRDAFGVIQGEYFASGFFHCGFDPQQHHVFH